MLTLQLQQLYLCLFINVEHMIWPEWVNHMKSNNSVRISFSLPKKLYIYLKYLEYSIKSLLYFNIVSYLLAWHISVVY